MTPSPSLMTLPQDDKRNHIPSVMHSSTERPRSPEMRSLIYALPVAVLAALACAKKEAPADTTHAAATGTAASSATRVGEAAGMKTPESVRYDPELDVYYITNIKGN